MFAKGKLRLLLFLGKDKNENQFLRFLYVNKV